MAKRVQPAPAESNEERAALKLAWEQWRAALQRSGDTRSRHVVEVLQALLVCTARDEPTLAKLAKLARPVGGSAAVSDGPELVDWLERVFREPSDVAAEAIVARLQISARYGNPADAAVDRVREVLVSKLDPDEKVVAVFTAYGLTPADARNRLKFRYMRDSRPESRH